MPSDFEDVEPSLDLGEVERRGEPRGIMRDLRIVVDGGVEREVLEASRKGVFVVLDDPDSMKLGTNMDVTVRRTTDDRSFSCRVEVTRKEIRPRCGAALRIIRISPRDEEMLKLILESA
jgi:hypothetical protein